MLLGIDNCYNRGERKEREREKKNQVSHLFRLIITLRKTTFLVSQDIVFHANVRI